MHAESADVMLFVRDTLFVQPSYLRLLRAAQPDDTVSLLLRQAWWLGDPNAESGDSKSTSQAMFGSRTLHALAALGAVNSPAMCAASSATDNVIGHPAASWVNEH
jgi:hypothetical protein